MKIKSRKFLFLAFLILAVAVVAGFALVGEEEQMTSVQADLVIRDDISEIVTASGLQWTIISSGCAERK